MRANASFASFSTLPSRFGSVVVLALTVGSAHLLYQPGTVAPTHGVADGNKIVAFDDRTSRRRLRSVGGGLHPAPRKCHRTGAESSQFFNSAFPPHRHRDVLRRSYLGSILGSTGFVADVGGQARQRDPLPDTGTGGGGSKPGVRRFATIRLIIAPPP